MEKIEVAQPANLLRYKKGYSIDFVRKTIGRQSLNGLQVSDVFDPLPDLDFLAECTFLKYLSIGSLNDHDYSFLTKLTRLKWLYIGPTHPMENPIDLSHQTELEDLRVNWRKSITGWERLKRLESLSIMDCTEKSLSFVRPLTALKDLWVGTGSMKDLNGIEGCKGLESIVLGNCRWLATIAGLNHLPNLRKIELDAVSKAKDYDRLDDLPSLAELTIVNCRDIPSIRFIRHFPSLKKMTIVGNTVVADGDLTPALGVEQVFYVNRSHYNVAYPPPNLKKL
jgi:Leucine-rich repeat (LRR) protein